MDNDDPWAAYARIQALADSNYISIQAYAADETLETILDMIELGQAVSPRQADNLLKNRARTQRERRALLALNADLLHPISTSEDARVTARSELASVQGRCSPHEWWLLISAGLGYTCQELAIAGNVPDATIKTRIRRARLKLAA
jgi:hypothetical protein